MSLHSPLKLTIQKISDSYWAKLSQSSVIIHIHLKIRLTLAGHQSFVAKVTKSVLQSFLWAMYSDSRPRFRYECSRPSLCFSICQLVRKELSFWSISKDWKRVIKLILLFGLKFGVCIMQFWHKTRSSKFAWLYYWAIFQFIYYWSTYWAPYPRLVIGTGDKAVKETGQNSWPGGFRSNVWDEVESADT